MKWKFLVLVTAIILALANPLVTFAQFTRSYTVGNGSISGLNTGRYNNRPLTSITPTPLFLQEINPSPGWQKTSFCMALSRQVFNETEKQKGCKAAVGFVLFTVSK